MPHNAPNINHLWARLLVEELVRGGCRCFVVAPGSRSTPLALSVANNPNAEAHVHFDERGVGFFALGHARATGEPAAVICTSGSAVANLWPAMVEAEALHLPLILITGDRPPELLQTGANQAIDQEHIFGRYTRWAFTLPCPSVEIPPRFVLTTAAHALQRARGVPAGPVHLNCQFREPLAPVLYGAELKEYIAPLDGWLHAKDPYTRTVAATPVAGEVDLQQLAGLLNEAPDGLVLTGELRCEEDRTAAMAMAEQLQWPLLPDITSGLRTGKRSRNIIPCYDQLLLSARHSLREVRHVLHLGGRITSKRLHQFLAQRAPGASYIHVAEHAMRLDPEHVVTLRIQSKAATVARAVTLRVNPPASRRLLTELQETNARCEQIIDEWTEQEPGITEVGVARMLSRFRPEGSVLYLGNSMPVRDMDMYAAGDGAPGPVHASRGASGIDGNIATAAGLATGIGNPLTAILGDLAVLHDLNSLAILRKINTPFVLLIINNDGGGIFSFMPVAESAQHFERFFGTPHGFTFEAAAKMFGLHYAAPQTMDSLKASYREAIQESRASIIEVRTNREENVRQHRALQAKIMEALERE